MDELKQAYEKMGLPEDASREQVEQRYFLLMKKSRSRQQREVDQPADDELDIDAINRAYNRILGYEAEKEGTGEKQTKAGYFFYYYKFHTIAVIVALVLIILTVKGIVDRHNEEAHKPPLDLAVTVYGNFFGTDADRLSQNLLHKIPQWKRIDINVNTIPKEIKSQQDMALQQKGMITLMTDKMDLLIVDESNFETLAKQKVFMPLDRTPFWPELQKHPERIRNALADEETVSHPYGVDITGNDVFSGTQVGAFGEKQILAVRFAPAHQDKAFRMLQALTLPK